METFVPVPDVGAAGGGPAAESTNVSRAAALASLLMPNNRELSLPIVEPLLQLGFRDHSIGALGDPESLAAGLIADWFAGVGADIASSDARQASWRALNDNADSQAAMAFLIGMLGSPLERESAVAAAALWRVFSATIDQVWLDWTIPLVWIEGREYPSDFVWDGEAWQAIFAAFVPDGRTESFEARLSQLRPLVAFRLRLALRSVDHITQSFALALELEVPGPVTPGPTGTSVRTPAGSLVVSTMVHGTWGWKGDWWRPKGGFHRFMLENHRPNLYGRGARFSWSGAYSQAQRITAAEDLLEWAQEVAPNGLQTVFAHSYGGEVAAMAASAGATTQELVMLSVPGTVFVNIGSGAVSRVIDVRLPFDPVLALARTPQRLMPQPNLTAILLPWSLDHAASHNETLWISENVAQATNL